jgi:hypothetical protein
MVPATIADAPAQLRRFEVVIFIFSILDYLFAEA